MASRGRLLGAYGVVVAMLAAAGCGSSTDNKAEARPAAINGSTPTGNNAPAPDPAVAKAAKPAPDTRHAIVKIETSMGTIVVRLDREKAPLTVDNFLTYVEQGFYDQTIFHQVQKGYVILGGGFAADLLEKQARARIRNEAHNGRKNTKGTIAMARVANYHDSASCQFFFNVADNPPLDYKPPATPGALVPAEQYGYCVFGDVTEGMDVLEKIANVPVEDRTLPGTDKRVFERIPTQTVLIKSARHVQ